MHTMDDISWSLPEPQERWAHFTSVEGIRFYTRPYDAGKEWRLVKHLYAVLGTSRKSGEIFADDGDTLIVVGGFDINYLSRMCPLGYLYKMDGTSNFLGDSTWMHESRGVLFFKGRLEGNGLLALGTWLKRAFGNHYGYEISSHVFEDNSGATLTEVSVHQINLGSPTFGLFPND